MSAVPPTSRAFVDLAAYAHNLNYARTSASIDMMAVVKGDGYGLGAVPLAQRALETGAALLGVATVGEGAALRDGGIDAPVVVLMQPEAGALPAVVDYGLALTLCGIDAARALDELGRKAGKVSPVHAMVDTGMGRQGFSLDAAARDIPEIARLANLRLAGIATHYPVADAGEDPFTREQIARLKTLLADLDAAGVAYGAVHGANSPGIINFPDPVFTLARAGIMCYGAWPTDAMPDPNPLRPVLRWVTAVSQVRAFPPGHSISYGRTYISEGGMTGAILPVGYADGYRRAFSNKADVLIHGQRCPVRGRVCMDQVVVDVSHLLDVAVGDEAVLAGIQGGDVITLEELAAHADTIPYEILTGIGRRVEREYIN